AELMLERTMHQWIALLEAHNVPCGPINNIDQVFDDPQVQHRGLRTNMQHPGGPISLLASPLRFADTPVRYELPPPLLGQHTEQVLQQLLGLGADDVAALRARRVV
ncbi:MAG TPA: CoA transferase, partial [Rubrivivax sp.]|nr:CoA transferase [Rubrivivax sp.]